ncbi:MAG: adenylate/guanylate cyclase domain-containing protein [Magnetospirillum sp.]|nr:adenylate/guanylate cyclase domain-containing protein [Magnetospirillum sp.]
MIIVHYEVYVLEGRGWMLHARFPRTERETAIGEAKELEQTLSVRVRVLRETYYTDDNAFEEAEVYATGTRLPDKPKQAAGAAMARPAATGARASISTTTSPAGRRTSTPMRRPPPARPRRQRSPEETAQARQLLGRLLAITAIALAAALLSIKLTPNAIMILWQMGFNWTVTPESYGRLLFFVFVCVFLMVAVPLSIRFLPRQTAIPRFHKPSFAWSGAEGSAAAPPEDPARERAVKKSLDKLAAKALAEQERGTEELRKPETKAEDDAPPNLADDLPEIRPGRDDDLPEIRPDPEDLLAEAPLAEASAKRRDEEQKAAREAKDREAKEAWEAQERAAREKEEAEKKADKADKPEKQDEAARKEKKEAETVRSVQPTVMRFLNGAVNQAKTLAPNMDALTKFALHLYLAGAVETLCDFRKLGDAAKSKLVALALETLGTRADLALKFYDKLEEYLMEPRYLGVVQAGRDAMGDFMLGDETNAHQALRDAFLEWNRKGDKKAQIVTIMFTDMVGSTDMTQARGDAAAQEVVRRHNSIVRGALAQFGGKEIKHTGDGIMASFATAAAAVEATIAIQRQVDQHNQRLPNQALHLRIGLNAGEPIEEEDDLFGATVQLAARVCAATNADQVLCTGVVKDLTVGKGAATFRAVGTKYLKGFKDAVALFEVVWKN